MELQASITEDGALSLSAEGTQWDAVHATVTEARKEARNTAVSVAREADQTVRLVITDPSGLHVVHVDGDGTVTEQRPEIEPEVQPEVEPDIEPEVQPEVEPDIEPEVQPDIEPDIEPEVQPDIEPDIEPEVQPDIEPEVEPDGGHGRDSSVGAPSFLESGPEALAEPAQQGWQGWMNRTLGLRLAASPAEARQREAVAALQQSWVGPRTVAVLNSKGGANKTPTSIRLCSELARNGGGGVLAWDNNESLGTMGWRVETEDHGHTVLDFLRAARGFLRDDARRADLARFVHHQSQDTFDVLISDDDPQHDHLVTGKEVDLIHEVAARNWRLIVMDSGNSTRGENFTRMIQHADQVVLATTTESDKAQGAVDSWRALHARGGRAAQLAAEAVVIVSEANTSNSLSAQTVVERFGPYVRAVHIVPFDPALVQGVMRAQDLKPRTRRAWQLAAADVIAGFRDTDGRPRR